MIKSAAYIYLVYFGILTGCGQRNGSVQRSNSDEPIPQVSFISRAQLDSILHLANSDSSTTQSLGAPELLDKAEGGESYYVIKRTMDGFVEMHEQWDDVVIMRSGHGILRTGRKVNGLKLLEGEKPARSWYGGQIVDIKENHLSPGDFFIIPAMTAHQYIPNKNDTLTYWTIKIKRARSMQSVGD